MNYNLKSPYVAIIDYGLGNLFSVKNACDHIGLNSKITNSKLEISNAGALILPGVGAFKQAMDSLKSLNLIDVIVKFADSDRPLIGICLGMQLLFEQSKEFGLNNGLGLVKGEVKKFDVPSSVKVPHIGWNSINKIDNNSWGNDFFKNQINGDDMYFIHSYFCQPIDSSIIKAKTKYGGEYFCSAIVQNNIFGVQFHPERSAEKGLNFYKNIRNIIQK